MSVRDIVLVGGGQASAVATRTLRRRGYDGTITIVGDEPLRPYQRPPLSKEYLTGGDETGLFLLPEAWTDEHDVRVITGTRALKISAPDASVLLEDGTSLPADRVLLATGGSPRRLPDTDGERIVYLLGRMAPGKQARSKLLHGVIAAAKQQQGRRTCGGSRWAGRGLGPPPHVRRRSDESAAVPAAPRPPRCPS